MNKDELIAKYGADWYERLKVKSRERYKKKYDADPESERRRRRERYAKDKTSTQVYRKEHAEIYRINSRDRNRLVLMGVSLEGLVVHHLAYHADKTDGNWLNDIVLMTREEHQEWHNSHPDFVAAEHIVYCA